MKNKKTAVMAGLILLALLLAGCAADHEMYQEKPAGFWAGLWHGLIVIVTFFISLFTDRVTIYEVNNSGNGYHLGFVLGILLSLGHGEIWNPVKKSFSVKCRKEKEWDEK